MNTKLMIASVIAITVAACGNIDTSEINQRVEGLIQYIPDHNKPQQNAQQAYTAEYWSLLDKAWQIPMPDGEIGDGEFLCYFIEGNGGCSINEGKHQVVPIETKVISNTSAYEIFDYVHPDGTKERHKMILVKEQDQWIIDDYDSTKLRLKEYIDNNFITPDLAFMEVKGRVKSVIYTNKRKAYFDEQGNITKYCTEFSSTHNFNDGMFDEVEDNGDVEVQLTRDNNGYITNTYDGPGGSQFYEYDTTAIRLTLRGGGDGGYWSATKFGFDEEGYPTFSIVESDLGEETETDPERITYDKTDSHGNWLKRANEERTIEYYE
ncbi:MAG: hypothetical protein J6Z01_16060 [Bacteroidales bacterium]|nr:hypothetical protein [Bacteroidales bacterium]